MTASFFQKRISTTHVNLSSSAEHHNPMSNIVENNHSIYNAGLISVNGVEETVNVIQGKGEFLGGGTTGLVERLKSGDVIKSPWTGRPTAFDCRQEMAIEAQIYKRLGTHPRLVQLREWNPVDHTLVLEYMPSGNLKDYVKDYRKEISLAQKQRWIIEAAECIELLHSHGIVQCDVGPHNFLLDVDLSLKICDFAGSSIDGSRASVAPGVRYRIPGLARRNYQPASVKEDLFALGSTIYFIATGYEPFSELTDDDEVKRLYDEGVFPKLDGIPFADIIASCWRQEIESAEVITELVKRSLA